MKKFILFALLLGGSQIFISCNSMKSVAKIKKERLFIDRKINKIQPTFFTINTDATQRTAYVLVKEDKFVSFSENPPDAAVQATMSLFVEADVMEKVDATAQMELAKSIAQLGNRSEAINFQRDGLFRLSEMYNNGALEPTQLITLIESLQQKAVQIAELAAKTEESKHHVEKIKELNKLFALADSASAKPSHEEILKLVSNL